MNESTPQQVVSGDGCVPASQASFSPSARIGFAIVAVLTLVGWVREVNGDHRDSTQWFQVALSWAFTFAAPLITVFCARKAIKR